MTQINQSLPAVVRRRARELHGEGKPMHWLAPLVAAAEELELRQRIVNTDETAELAINLLGDCRRLRAAVWKARKVAMLPMKQKPGNWQFVLAETLRQALVATPDLAGQRVVLSVEIKPGQTRDDIEGKVHAALDKYFAAPAPVAEGNASGFADDVASRGLRAVKS